MSKRTYKQIGLLVVITLLMSQLLPMHLHVHNHSHGQPGSHTSTEIHITNLETDALSHHSHATVINLNETFLTQKTDLMADYDLLALFLLVFLFLLQPFVRILSRALRATARKTHAFILSPPLRAPPIPHI